jgi:hypothetical protein
MALLFLHEALLWITLIDVQPVPVILSVTLLNEIDTLSG